MTSWGLLWRKSFETCPALAALKQPSKVCRWNWRSYSGGTTKRWQRWSTTQVCVTVAYRWCKSLTAVRTGLCHGHLSLVRVTNCCPHAQVCVTDACHWCASLTAVRTGLCHGRLSLVCVTNCCPHAQVCVTVACHWWASITAVRKGLCHSHLSLVHITNCCPQRFVSQSPVTVFAKNVVDYPLSSKLRRSLNAQIEKPKWGNSWFNSGLAVLLYTWITGTYDLYYYWQVWPILLLADVTYTITGRCDLYYYCHVRPILLLVHMTYTITGRYNLYYYWQMWPILLLADMNYPITGRYDLYYYCHIWPIHYWQIWPILLLPHMTYPITATYDLSYCSPYSYPSHCLNCWGCIRDSSRQVHVHITTCTWSQVLELK
jgi:hypothetical protein